ncbi:MAG: DUF3078 domain-containing protein [Bacteroidetes bacterium]|nr:MAG: DUF3078 domain-containing protein [Bacteroidota bacterium]REK08088.1 MAG: DUF3078 domain-containing protein [Bacteroidota bacterium]REK32293.1 MAG: DUF3078 domain-containing protein [Bacteroidota bacterium]REK49527.1 MAG: DUF3078 domain-containing protein [Bacteroidota bacterium]
MKKPILFIALIILSTINLSAQSAEADTSWKKGGFIGVNLTQVNFSHWAPGGDNNVSVAGNVNLFANYAKDKTIWDNSLDLAYALVKTGSEDVRKSDDKIDFTSKYGYRVGETKWYYAGLVNFKSQFAEGFKYPDDSNVVSKFLAPAYLTIALGLTYKPVDYFEVFFSPATGKWTFVTMQSLADAGAYGVDPARIENNMPVAGSGKNTRSEFGAYLNMKFKKDIMQNVTLSSKLELFNNYTDKDKDNARNVDVNWETALNLKVNKFITASVNVQVVYDANVIERTQFKEVIGVGFGYKF